MDGALGAAQVGAPSREDTIGQLIATLSGYQKSNAGAPAYSRFVNRPLGRVFAATAFKLGATPNHVTLVSGACSLAGIVLIALVPPSVGLGVVVGFLLVLGYALDSADGQLARLRGGGSSAGEWLDHIVDCIKVNLLHAAVLVSLERFTDLDRPVLLLPMAFLVVANIYFFAYTLGDLLKRVRGAKPAKGGHPSALRSLLVAPTDYGVMCLVFLLWGVTPVFLAAYAVMLLGTAGYVTLGLPKWFSDMVDLDRVPR